MFENAPDHEVAPHFDRLTADVTDTPDGAQCTIYPENADADELITTWVTADERSFVPLEKVR